MDALEQINQAIENKRDELEKWFEYHLGCCRHPVYCSIDFRNAGFKVAGIDANIFPSGFNNLCNDFRRIGSDAFKKFVGRCVPDAKRVLIYPEGHTRNKFYLDNIMRLVEIIGDAGYEHRVGFPFPTGPGSDSVEYETSSESKLKIYNVRREENFLLAGDFKPDLIFLNNDLSGGMPAVLAGVKQKVLPSPKMGWYQRKKSRHFFYKRRFIEDFAKTIGLDPWLMTPLTSEAIPIDFDSTESCEYLAKEVETILNIVKEKYRNYGIDRTPYVYIKDNAGTYGMGILHVHSGDDVRNLNSKQRKKLKYSRRGHPVEEVIVQEGVATGDLFENHPMEPVIYMIGGVVVGGFYRIHSEKEEEASLNAPGAEFQSLCFHKVDKMCEGKESISLRGCASLINVYGTLARISSIALAREEDELK